MMPDALAIAGLVAVLLPTLYFLIATPMFFLAKFEDPKVTWLFRTVTSFHFRATGIGSAIAAVACMFAGRPVFAAVLAAIGALAIAMRRWLLRNWDEDIHARDSGDAKAIRRLRALQWRGMAYNAAQLAALVAIIPFAFPGV